MTLKITQLKAQKVKKKQFHQSKFVHKVKCPDCYLLFSNVEFETHKLQHSVLYSSLRDGIYEVQSKAIVEYVNQELGSPSEEYDKVYSKILSRKIVGVVVVKRTFDSFRLLSPTSVSDTKLDTILGISRIWTHPGHRKKGIAVEMLEHIRNHYLFGTSIEVDQLSFSQPTEMGYALGCKYFGRADFPVHL
jgi:GNAT superfamily N-acetyltransferase